MAKDRFGRIIADANAKGEVRAYVDHPQTHFPLNEQGKLDVRRAVGTNGFIMVVKDVGMKVIISSLEQVQLFQENLVKILLDHYATK